MNHPRTLLPHRFKHPAGLLCAALLGSIIAAAHAQAPAPAPAAATAPEPATQPAFEFPTSTPAAGFQFTSVPDLFNWNIRYPQPGWEEAMDWFLGGMKKEGPAFMLNAGDIMDARWWESAEQVRAKTEEYWGGFKRRFQDKDITIYIAPGDHEYGDDAGMKKIDLARVFAEQFVSIFDMPKNGPDHKKGRAYSFTHENLAVISLDTFEDAGDRMTYTVSPEQLAWLEKTLEQYRDKEFIIVQGHLPVIGPVNSANSSRSMLRGGGPGSDIWTLMAKHGVDAYLCGEHHRITVKHEAGLWQIVHGALWGTQTDVNYLRGCVEPGKLTLELFEFDVEYAGGKIGDHENRKQQGPREKVTISADARSNGPRSLGKLVIEKTPDGKKTAQASGLFEQ